MFPTSLGMNRPDNPLRERGLKPILFKYYDDIPSVPPAEIRLKLICNRPQSVVALIL